MDLDYYENSLALATNKMNSKIKVEVTHEIMQMTNPMMQCKNREFNCNVSSNFLQLAYTSYVVGLSKQQTIFKTLTINNSIYNILQYMYCVLFKARRNNCNSIV